MIISKFTRLAAPVALAGLMAIEPSLAQEAAPEAAAPAFAPAAETTFVFNTLLFLIGGFLVMFMAAGFCMLEAGLVRSKNVSMQCLKNIGIFSIAGIAYWAIGYNIMYDGVDGGYFGSFSPKVFPAPDADDITVGYSTASDWFFQMAFCAAAASIVSGAVAERIKVWPFLIFTTILTAILYPISGSWKWGAGWLDGIGFSDFAGSTIVHSVGGWAALTGAIIIGARTGKYGPNGSVTPLPGSSIPLATLGTFILWLGWFGFNGASQLAIGTLADAASVSQVFANTNLAACGGVVCAIILTQLLYGKVDVTMALNGALGGLVSITAEPLTPAPYMAILIGAIGGAIVVFTVPLLDKLKIDDVVGAVPVHLFCGIWGTLAVVLTNSDATLGAQITGIVAYAVFGVVTTSIVWLALKYTMGLRPTVEEELAGLDKLEVGVEAYPDFGGSAAR